MSIKTPRNNGKFIQGYHYSPHTEFKHGQVSRNKGVKDVHKGEKNPNYKGGKREVKCSFCGTIKLVKPYILKTVKNHFCSKPCAGKYRSLYNRGIKNANYIHGEGYFPYPSEFNDTLKEEIRKRDNYKCQNCGMTEEEHLSVYGTLLTVHHIDYNKKNCEKTNLITLDRSCNIRANSNREHWKSFFYKKIGEMYGKKSN